MATSQAWRWCRRTALPLANFVALVLVLWAASVQAHADVAQAIPAPSALLQQAPERVTLWFTEPIAPDLSTMQVLNAQGERMERGPSTVDPSDLTTMSVALHPVPQGVYTVVWHNVSHIDGHRVQGSFVFSVGTPSEGLPREAAQEAAWFQTPLEPFVRWLVLLSATVLVGGLGFRWLVLWLPLSSREHGSSLQRMQQQMATRTLQRVQVALHVLLVASLGQLGVQAMGTVSAWSQMSLGSLLATVLTGTQWGHLWLWRLAILMALAVVLGHSSGMLCREDGRETLAGHAHWTLLALALGLGSGVLLTLSLGSHGAATTNIREAALGADYLHLLAAAGWIGGLFHLTCDVPHILRTLSSVERGALLAVLISRFSLIAIFCVGTLIITGFYSAWVQVTVLPALRTPYGLTLLAKLALLIPLLLLGVLNLLWVRPRLAREDRAGRWLCRFVAGEAVLGTLVLGAVGCLTSLEPAGQAAARQGLLSTPGLTFSELVEGTRLRLTLVPGGVGLNRLRMSLSDHWGAPIAQASEVSLRLQYLEAELGEVTLAARALGDGTYVFEQVLLSIAGPWQAQLLVRRADAFDARSTFQFTVMPWRSDLLSAITPARHTGMLLWGGVLVLLGGLCLVMGIPLRGWRTPVGALVIGCGLLCTLAGLLVVHQQMGPSGALTAPAMLESFRETPRRQRTTHHGAGQGERRDT